MVGRQLLIVLLVAVCLIGTAHSATRFKRNNNKNNKNNNGNKNNNNGNKNNGNKNNKNNCGSNMFACKNGECIDSDLNCDGKRDCSDGSDEENHCKSIKCPGFLFACAYGACINKELKCDGTKDCADGSDEANCKKKPSKSKCPFGQFECNNGQCIDQFDLCDGKKDCSDGSDETKKVCKDIQCPTFNYRCDYGACISKTGRCNSIIDCADGSDEKGCEYTVTDSPITQAPVTQPTPIIPTIPPDVPVVTDGPIGDSSCTVPTNINFASFYYYNQTQRVESGAKISNGQLIEIKCNARRTPIPNTAYYLCLNGLWVPNEFSQCVSYCPPIKETLDNHLKIKCTDEEGNKVSCELPLDGYSVKLACDTFYESATIAENPIRFCRDGSWDLSTNIKCTPECGQKFVPATTLVVGGKEVEKDHYPWTVGIYNSSQTHICGGALLNMRVVLSAAHCFAKENNGQINPASDYHVAAGKHYRDYNHPDDNHVEYGEVELIQAPSLYKGSQLYHQADVAIVVLKKPLNINIAIRPVCLDRGNAFEAQQLVDGNMGTTTGWGFTSDNSAPSDVLKELTAPYYPENKCKQLLSPELEPYYTYDKLCVGWVNASQAVCRGDSGGALVFLSATGRYFIRGIVSISPRDPGTGGCDTNTVTLYTKVSKHLDFINLLESKYRP